MKLTKEQQDKIKKVRKDGGFSYVGIKKALEETNWNTEHAYRLLLDNDDYGKYKTLC